MEKLEILSASVVGNSLILHKILPYLPLRDVKNFRLVSPFWGHEGLKYLLKLSCVEFPTWDITRITNYTAAADAEKIFAHPNLRIWHNRGPIENWQPVLNLLQKYAGNIRWLSLRIEIRDLQCLNILPLTKYLEVLEIHFTTLTMLQLEEVEENVGIIPKFGFLKNVLLRVFLKSSEELGRPHSLFTVLNKFEIFKAIQKLEVVIDPKVPDSIGSIILEEVLKSRNLTNLNHIRLPNVRPGMLQKILGRENISLKRFELGNVPQSEFVSLSEILGRNSATLVILEIGFQILDLNEQFAEEILHIPNLPELRRLQFGPEPCGVICHPRGSDRRQSNSKRRLNERGVNRRVQLLRCIDGFDIFNRITSNIIQGGGTAFQTKFPKLTHLELKVGGFKDHEFFCSDEWKHVVLSQIKVLSVEFRNLAVTKDAYNRVVDRLLEIFPNVRHPYVRSPNMKE
ncbi:hypothetical protein Fcan01_00762 [Folsomia candida]|uniref:FBD domain-containing protein n=1 Tax=Folsomia candida TaxID=158441 RepID=A0A226F1L5_FOLCA|nr:hypothetical protein Fcan01_00762 [Folsomia candida]